MPLPWAWTFVHATPRALLDSRRRFLREADFHLGLLELPPPEKEGILESAPLWAPFPFDELVLSANADLPERCSLSLETQVLVRGRWSPWFWLGQYSPGDSQGGSLAVRGIGAVDVDTLVLERPAEAFRYRLRLRNEGGPKSPLLRLVSAVISDRRRPPRWGRGPKPPAGAPWVRDLDVPRRSQMVEDPRLRRDICSPTAVAMMLAYWNIPVETAQAARGVFDSARRVYGNWTFNTAYAGAFGVDAYVSRMTDPSELEAEVAQGRPVVVSLSFEKGELRGAPIPRTRGHLLVVRGFDPAGNVIVNDPAAPGPDQVRRVYRREQFLRAWLRNKRGLCYKISPRLPRLYKVAVPVSHLRREPEPLSPFTPSRDELQESQLLMGEPFLATSARGGWVYGESPEQLRLPPGSGEHGYPGWVEADDLSFEDRPPVTEAVVRKGSTEARCRDAHGHGEGLGLSMGTRFAVLRWGTRVLGMLPGSGPAWFRRSDVRLPGRPPRGLRPRREILDAARQFLGQRYFWGGRSSARLGPGCGVDCSGLVSLAYRAQGLDLPRDSHDQFLRVRRLKRNELKVADLIFLSEDGNPDRISHVMLYAGGGRVIEASGDFDRVRDVPLKEKLGTGLEELEDGLKVNGRTVYLGTYLD